MKPAQLSTRSLLGPFLGPFLGAALALPAVAQRVGEKVDIDFEDFTQTAAGSLQDYQGRAILIEYFAYW